jgi:Skp family chaperone for outer membrane proteins
MERLEKIVAHFVFVFLLLFVACAQRSEPTEAVFESEGIINSSVEVKRTHFYTAWQFWFGLWVVSSVVAVVFAISAAANDNLVRIYSQKADDNFRYYTDEIKSANYWQREAEKLKEQNKELTKTKTKLTSTEKQLKSEKDLHKQSDEAKHKAQEERDKIERFYLIQSNSLKSLKNQVNYLCGLLNIHNIPYSFDNMK